MKGLVGGSLLGSLILTASAYAITIEDLQETIIQTRVSYDMRIRRAEGIFDTQMVMVWKFKIDPEGRVSGEMTRTVTTPRGPREQTTPMRGRIDKPGSPARTWAGRRVGARLPRFALCLTQPARSRKGSRASFT